MRILIFNWRDPKHSWAGGGEMYVFEQAMRWVRMGHHVSVFCSEDVYKKLLPFETSHGIKIYRKGGRYSVYLWAIWYYVTRFRRNFDVVIDVENGIPFFTPLFSAVPKVCFVYHVHGKQFFYELSFPFNYIGYVIERYIFPIIYKSIPIIAISETTRKHLVNIGFKKSNITIVFSGVNKRNKKENNAIKKFSNPTILYLGRIKAYKRIDLLVQIFPKILERVPKARLFIAGWGTEASNVVDLVMRSQFRKKISLVGPVNEQEKRNLLSRSWVFVNPSIGEGWSIAVIEANMFGTPAVSFKVSGLTESIQHGKTGLLANSEEKFIDMICSVLFDKRLCDRLSKNARIWAHQFDWDKTAKESLVLIEKLVGK